MQRLFKAHTVTDNFKGCKGVWIDWFVLSRDKPLDLPYSELVEGHDDGSDAYFDSREAINELFTADEAQAFKAYIESTNTPEMVIVEPARLPYSLNTMPIRAIPLGGPQDSLMIWKRDGYPLRFRVEGYFDIRSAQTGNAE
jgi:hypothetical protein